MHGNNTMINQYVYGRAGGGGYYSPPGYLGGGGYMNTHAYGAGYTGSMTSAKGICIIQYYV